jgi:hypothetical protein
LLTKDHFSSNWASWVEGGKGHAFIVAAAGVRAGAPGVADDAVFIDAGQRRGPSAAAAVLSVPQDVHGLLLRQAGALQGGALALGEASLAGATGEQAQATLAVAEADAQVALSAFAVVGAVGVLAAEEAQVVHEEHHSGGGQAMDKITLGL